MTVLHPAQHWFICHFQPKNWILYVPNDICLTMGYFFRQISVRNWLGAVKERGEGDINPYYWKWLWKHWSMLRLEQIRAGRRQTHAAALTQTLIPPDTKPFQTWKKENDCKLKMERNEKIFQINRNYWKIAFKVSKMISSQLQDDFCCCGVQSHG